MTCSACSAHVEHAVCALEGVSHAEVSLLTNSMSVTYAEETVTPEDISAAVSGAGYSAAVYTAGDEKTTADGARDDAFISLKRRLIWSLVFALPLFYLSMGHMMGLPIPPFLAGHDHYLAFALAQLLLCIPVVAINYSYYTRGVKSLFHGAPNMDTLIAIGSGAAILYGIYAVIRIAAAPTGEIAHDYAMNLYFESAGTILTLITLGKTLEHRAKRRTTEAITRLLDLSPKTATVLRDGVEVTVPTAEIAAGDIVVLRAGETVPVDGEIIDGSCSVDESAITGESVPVDHETGGTLISATIVRSGFVRMRATKVGEDTTLAQIVRLVEEASSSKAPISRLADKVSGIFVPIVLSIAVLATVIWLIAGYGVEFSLSIGIAVLVISCPCALGLATPTAIMAGTGRGAQLGVLIRSGEALETAHKIDTVVLDKTGTVTEGNMRVTDALSVDDGADGRRRLLEVAAALEYASEHPIARAIVAYAGEQGVTPGEVTDFTAVAGGGVSATIDGVRCLGGNTALMEANGVDLTGIRETLAQYAGEGKTPILFARDGVLCGMLALADTIKSGSGEAIQTMKEMGIQVIMLTGDNEATANAIARRVGISHVISGVHPDGKDREISLLQNQGKTVAMVGDGINDAPALIRADVGMAVGAGTDIAIESADIVMMRSDLRDAVTAIRLSRATIRNIKENLGWAFVYNIIGIPIAAGIFYPFFGLRLDPMFAAAAMSLSSVCVVTNALRLRRFSPKVRHRHAAKGGDAPTEPIEHHENLSIEEDMDMFGKDKLVLHVEGMSCGHCAARVESALTALDSVKAAKVDLKKKTVTVTPESGEADRAELAAAIEAAGYQVVE